MQIIFLSLLLCFSTCSSSLQQSNSLSQPRFILSAATANSQILFGGGFVDGNTGVSAVVDVFDSSTHTWSITKLSQSRRAMASASNGTFAFFAGGRIDVEGDPQPKLSDVVDIYDGNLHIWFTAKLSQARYGLSAAAVGTKVIFAGGFYADENDNINLSDVVDIYDTKTNTWSTTKLSEARGGLTATAVGTKALFGGGFANRAIDSGLSDRVDIYDSSTSTWSTSKLSAARSHLAATAVGTKALFGGGFNGVFPGSDHVDIYDVTTGNWTLSKLTSPRYDLAATTLGNIVIFGGGWSDEYISFKVDIYDSSTNTWTIDKLSQARYGLAAASTKTIAIFAGGLGYQGLSSVVDIWGAFRPHTNTANIA